MHGSGGVVRNLANLRIAGRVVDGNDRPVLGATVWVMDWTFCGVLEEWRAETDGEGRYRVEGIGPGMTNVRVWVPGLAIAYPEVSTRVRPGEVTRIDLRLTEGTPLSFRVLDGTSGRPVQDVEVREDARVVARGPGEALRTAPLNRDRRVGLEFRAAGYSTETLVLDASRPGASAWRS